MEGDGDLRLLVVFGIQLDELLLQCVERKPVARDRRLKKMRERDVAVLVDLDLHVDRLSNARPNNHYESDSRTYARLEINRGNRRRFLVVGRKDLCDSLTPSCAHKHAAEKRQGNDSFVQFNHLADIIPQKCSPCQW